MASFAVDRNNMNRGTGERSGVWVFEEFMFADSVFGRAVVEYDATAVRVKNEDREVRAMIAPPLYDMQISGARVTLLEIHNDNGEVVLSLESVNGKTLRREVLQELELCSARVFQAFMDAEDDVISFEMGLL